MTAKDFSDRVLLSDLLLLPEWAARTPSAIALAALDREPLTFAGLYANVARGASLLQQAGVERDEVIAVVLPAGPEMVTLLLAGTSVGACAPLDPSLTADEFREIFARLQARTLITKPGCGERAEDAARQLGMRVLHLTVNEPVGAWSIAKTMDAPRDFGRRTGASMLFCTSATTGKPKIVPKTAAQMAAGALQELPALELSPADRFLCMMPMFHIHGLSCVLAQLAAGGSAMITEGFDAALFPSWFASLRPTWYTGGAPVHHAVLSLAEHQPATFARHPLRFARTTGPVADATLLNRLEVALGIPTVNGYGTTETNGITRNPVAGGKRGSVGCAFGLKVAVMDESGNVLAPGAGGEVVARGTAVTDGYLDDPQATEALFRNGWCRTGDVGYLDEDGFLFLTGRIKDFINRGGEKILPAEVDEVLLRHPAIAEAVAFSLPHRTLGEEVAAAVVLKPRCRESDTELREFAAVHLAPFKVPRRIFVVSEIPRTAMGKPKRSELAERFKLTPLVAESSTLRVPPELTEVWKSVLGAANVQPSDDFFAVGGDSLSATVMLARVEQVFETRQGRLERTQFLGTPTLANLAALLAAAGGRPRATPISGQGAEDLIGEEVLAFRRTGVRTPLICFPASSDGLPVYLRYLAESMGPSQPFFAIHPPQPVDGDRLLTVVELARRSVELLRTAVPKGPYLIAGHCYGGFLAYEVAQQLIAQGETVTSLLLFDVNAPGYPKVLSQWKRYARAIGALPPPGEIFRHARTVIRLAARQYRGRVRRRLASLGADGGLRAVAVRDLNGMAMWEYEPAPLTVPIVQFLAADQPISTRILDDPRMGWREWARAGFDVRRVPGDHFSMFSQEHAGVLAGEIQARLDQRAGAALA